MKEVDLYRKFFLEFMEQKIQLREPENLYEPMQYILQLGGKILRPVLVLMAAEIFGTKAEKALYAALAIEVFHNFSLVHDDIMDDAPLRRGKTTVHEKWDINTGILSGDAMLINAYRFFENYDGKTFRLLAQLFTDTAIKVCEGQQYDIDFEEKNDVSEREYMKMIEYKTAVLVGASLEMGAIIAGTSEGNRKKIYEFGRLLGLAFQLQDDYLDVFGDPEKFGKQVGGDIIENKKTYIYLMALTHSTQREAKQLEHLFALNPKDPTDKINSVMRIFETSNADEKTREAIEKYTKKAFEALEALEVDDTHKSMLREFGVELMERRV